MANATVLVRPEYIADFGTIQKFCEGVVRAGLYTTSEGGPRKVHTNVLPAGRRDFGLIIMLVVVNSYGGHLNEDLRIQRQSDIKEALADLLSIEPSHISVVINQNLKAYTGEEFVIANDGSREMPAVVAELRNSAEIPARGHFAASAS